MTVSTMCSITKSRYVRKAILLAIIILSTLVWLNMFNLGIAHLKPQPTAAAVIATQTPIAAVNSSLENSGNHLHFLRFDVMVKLVYAYFYSVYNFVPDVFAHAYTEHLRVWNGFKEGCDNVMSYWFDAGAPCKNKSSAHDFISAFRHTIDSIKKNGFGSNISQIPVDTTGVILNGAHRLAAATIMSQNATFQYFKTPNRVQWGYSFFREKGLHKNISDLIMLEWMKIQHKLPELKKKVSILSVFSNSRDKDEDVRKIVAEKCSKDGGILYEHSISVNKLGLTQLVRHMYGDQTWLPRKVSEMLSTFNSPSVTVLFMFFFGKNLDELTKCKYEVRKLYNLKHFKSSAHIPDSPEESLILAEMILNPNSVQFLNYGENGLDCQAIATELARRSALKPIDTLPGIFVGRDDFMFDSGSVLHLFNLRKRTDVDILFLHDIDKGILGNQNGFNIEPHAFKANAISPGRPWGEDHFNRFVKTKWDLFYDPNNYGFCYGIKFVSLEQLIRYKLKRNEPNKDQNDVNLILKLIGQQRPKLHSVLDYFKSLVGLK